MFEKGGTREIRVCRFDTYALLWLASGGGNLTEITLQKIDAAPQVFEITGFPGCYIG